MSATAAAVSFSIGLALLMLYFAPKPYRDVFMKPVRQRTLHDRIRQSLRLAGLYDKTPTFVISGLLAATAVVGFVSAVAFGNPFAAIIGVILVPAAFHFSLMSRQRRAIDRQTRDLIPFLNRMVTSVKAGRPAQRAYIEAVYASRALRPALSDSVAMLNSNVPFRQALLSTLDKLPLRMWAVFVRQLELHDELGGNLSEAIEKSVSQISAILQLQAEARADYAAQDFQQKLVALIGLGGAVLFALVVDMSIMSVLWTSVLGFIVLLIALSIMAFGIWFSRKQLRDFEKHTSI